MTLDELYDELDEFEEAEIDAARALLMGLRIMVDHPEWGQWALRMADAQSLTIDAHLIVGDLPAEAT